MTCLNLIPRWFCSIYLFIFRIPCEWWVSVLSYQLCRKIYKLWVKNQFIEKVNNWFFYLEYVYGVSLCMSKKVNLLSACRQEKKVGPNQTAVGSTLVVLKALNVVQLQNKRNWEGKLEGVEGVGGECVEKNRESGFYFFFFQVSSVPAWTLAVQTVEPLSAPFPE